MQTEWWKHVGFFNDWPFNNSSTMIKAFLNISFLVWYIFSYSECLPLFWFLIVPTVFVFSFDLVIKSDIQKSPSAVELLSDFTALSVAAVFLLSDIQLSFESNVTLTEEIMHLLGTIFRLIHIWCSTEYMVHWVKQRTVCVFMLMKDHDTRHHRNVLVFSMIISC